MKRKVMGYTHGNNADSSRNRAEKREAKRLQIATTEALLAMWENDQGNHHDYVLHLRAKLRERKNQLDAMGDSEMKLEDF